MEFTRSHSFNMSLILVRDYIKLGSAAHDVLIYEDIVDVGSWLQALIGLYNTCQGHGCMSGSFVRFEHLPNLFSISYMQTNPS